MYIDAEFEKEFKTESQKLVKLYLIQEDDEALHVFGIAEVEDDFLQKSDEKLFFRHFDSFGVIDTAFEVLLGVQEPNRFGFEERSIAKAIQGGALEDVVDEFQGIEFIP
ncbi:hypothetical protein L596_018421 [Steinernema carpocapsae]|uniref:Uncharacterized protein n=1 Tax=Steinernema carpocapsae TaxID=34508 RepID=A0A4U5N4M1_STECR|nr:hypothetical protein L596_018421 [Steinernema carpocapsae]